MATFERERLNCQHRQIVYGVHPIRDDGHDQDRLRKDEMGESKPGIGSTFKGEKRLTKNLYGSSSRENEKQVFILSELFSTSEPKGGKIGSHQRFLLFREP
jgi:hypothetical protein